MKKIVCFLLSACLCGLMMAETVSAEVVSDVPSGLTIEKNVLYANGNSVHIKKGEDGKKYAFDPFSGEKLLENNLNNISTIYGGAKNKTVSSDITLCFEDTIISTIYGGGHSDGNGPADVIGNVSIEVIGNVDADTIYGGGYARDDNGDAQAKVIGDVSIDVSANPKSYHRSIHGGGYADTNKENNTNASILGNINLSVNGRTYDISGGGSAIDEKSLGGIATADVLGDITMYLNNADVREVYCGGRASGNARINTNNINCIAKNSEIMIIVGGIYASDGAFGTAENVSLTFENCLNLYAYIFGGGQAYGGAISNVNNVSISIMGSTLPADKQWDNIVAPGVYSGGNASGENSKAITKKTSLNVENCITAATYYGGGDSSGTSTTEPPIATVEESTMFFKDNQPSEFEGEFYASTIIAGGSITDLSLASAGDTDISVVNCDFDGIWGGNEKSGILQPMLGQSNLNVLEELTINNVGDFDTITINSPLRTKKLRGKDSTTPTRVIVDKNILVGTPLIYCDEIENMENILISDSHKINYEIIDEQSIWTLAGRIYRIETKSSNGGSITKSMLVNEFESATIAWQAESAYQVNKVLLDGNEINVNGNMYTIENIQNDHVFEVVFEKIQQSGNGGAGTTDKPSIEDAVTESGEKVVVEKIKPTETMENMIGDSEIISTIQVGKGDEKVTVSLKLGRKLANKSVYVVQVNLITNQLELISIANADKKGNIEFQTESSQPLAITASLPTGFIKTVDSKSSVGDTYYVMEGNEFKKGWLKTENDDWYFFDYQSAILQSGKWIADGKDTSGATIWYSLSNDSKMHKSTWIASDQFGTKWYYVDENGTQVKNTYVDGYYIDENGVWKSNN